MRRRDLTAGLLLAATAGSALAYGPAKQHRIAFVSSAIPADQLTETAGPLIVRRFFEAMRGRGYLEQRNLAVARYSAEGQRERWAELAYDVVSSEPEVIITDHGKLMRLLKSEKIPVITIASDSDTFIWTQNLARRGNWKAAPGYRDNTPWVMLAVGPEIYGKQLQILKEAAPTVAKVGWLGPSDVESLVGRTYNEAGDRLGLSLVAAQPSDGTADALRRVLAELAQRQPDAIVVSLEGDFLAHRRLIVEFAEKNRLPAIYPLRDYVELGGLMAYGPDLNELGQHLADIVDRILNGVKSTDIPSYQPSKFELVLNQRTAKALGLTVPEAIVSRIDELIE